MIVSYYQHTTEKVTAEIDVDTVDEAKQAIQDRTSDNISIKKTEFLGVNSVNLDDDVFEVISE